MLHINKVKENNYMTISIDRTKTFNKTSHPFSKLVIEENYCNITVAINEKPKDNKFLLSEQQRLFLKDQEKSKKDNPCYFYSTQ